jgi:cobalt-zinc-cadmium resistance protein CzcA
LQECLNKTLTSNGLVKSLSYEIDVQKSLKSTVLDFGKTNIDYSYGQMNSYQKDNELSISQSFAFPTSYLTQNKLANANIQNAEINLIATQNEIVYQVKSEYFLTSYYFAKLLLLKQEDSIFQNFAMASKMRYEKGETTLLEKMSAETKLYEIKNMLVTTEADISIQLKKLQTLLNENQQILIFDTVLHKLDFNLITDSTVLQKNPSLAYYQNQIVVSKLQTKAEKSKLLPEISVGYFSLTNKELSANNRFTGIQAGVSIPLVFFSQKGQIQASKINTQIAQTNYEYAQNEISNEFQILLQEYKKNKKNLEFYFSYALPNVELSLRQAGTSYNSGEIGYVEYLQFLNQAIDVKSTYLETLNSYNQTIIEIEKILNKL